ncbi:3-hydroxyacyl-CoA dehydrogenase NAD-binding domain-containing protein [Croceicoccus sp. BE223]|uniref:3-hydroxyacyl-CoA dehydrogenase NAD-binding domain-containing protein n=1 Tax=Croceicoccus sp. BE223 TaxID=2817716 RepID=UPI0028647A21|nr:3-hydroxyacyl-CoA dehydrogenase NAD-binding domain-containing protein [Croceicoccus sp. BE223]MDR7101105.1 3-hydroxybutyryl-CoA dehydrogenase [Croceicoccus sp. BE223]
MPERETVIVVGAGLMGAGIAHAFAASDCDVLLVDTSRAALDKALDTIRGTFAAGVERGKITAEVAEAGTAAIATAEALDERAGRASLLIETATENLAVKCAIMADAADRLPPDAIIATNTSALSISEIANAGPAPDRVIGMHFFNPVPKMKLVEIILGLETSRQTLERTIGWTGRIGKDHIVVNEAPGFTTSRMSALMGNEAMHMLSEGVASAEDIDKSLRMAFNHPMGPLETGDLTGWDTRLKVLEYLYEVMGERFRPCPLIRKMVKAGRHGRKTGKGVYEYDAAGQRIPGSGLKVSR